MKLKMENLTQMGSNGFASDLRSQTAFQWEGTISAILLLIVNWAGRRSALRTTLLVLYLFTSFPDALFKILRGEFGCWVAFLAVAAHLLFPQTFSASRFVLFVITPECVANGLRNGMVGGVFCLLLAVLLLFGELRQIGVLRNCEFSFSSFFYFLGLSFLLLSTIFYLF